jgi:hypothetical protein
MSDLSPASVVQRLATDSPQPVVLLYHPVSGWTKPGQKQGQRLKQRLTVGVAQKLRSEGYTMVQLRHRFRTYNYSLLNGSLHR